MPRCFLLLLSVKFQLCRGCQPFGCLWQWLMCHRSFWDSVTKYFYFFQINMIFPGRNDRWVVSAALVVVIVGEYWINSRFVKNYKLSPSESHQIVLECLIYLLIKCVLWCPIKVRVFHQNESCLSCPHPPLSYEGRRGSSHFDEKLSFW